MKKLTTSLGMLAISLAVCAPFASARDISKNEALRTAKDFVKSRPQTRSLSGALEFAYAEPSATSEADCFFVFNIGSEGFVIVSGDSDAVPVLGYSDKGSFDPKDVPANVRWWLDQYRQQIDAYRGIGAPTTRAGVEYKYVAPLITTEWDQTAPYNDLCPELPNDNNVKTRAYTGCVATAAAQIMNYHQWPKGPGKGYREDFFEPSATYDFASMNIDWEALKTTPKVFAASSQAARTAVANLMLACGVAFDMQYKSKSEGSGAWSYCAPDAFYNYLGYAPTVAYRERNGYNDDQWKGMLYAELAAGRPVLYAGKSESSGHAFVCDGYEEGKFHFNWGWSGSYDGFFALDAMYPQGGGSGSGDWSKGYNQNQTAVIGIKPPVEDEEPATHAYLSNGATTYVGMNTTNTDRAEFRFKTSTGEDGFRIRWRQQMYFVAAMGIWDNTGTKLLGYSGSNDINKIEFNTTNKNWKWGYDFYYSNGQGPTWSYSQKDIITLMPAISDGTYILRPVSRVYKTDDGNKTPIQKKYHIIPSFNKDYTRDLVMTVKNGVATYAPYQQPEYGAIIPTGLLLSQAKATVEAGRSLQITATTYPETQVAAKLYWTSDDADVATVDNTGLVKGVAPGETIIRVQTNDGSLLQAFCNVIVDKAGGVFGVEDAAVKVVAIDGQIVVEGAAEDAIVEVYDVAGLKVAQAKGNCTIPVDVRGIYVVRVGAYQAKVRL